MFKKSLLGLVIYNITLCNINAMDPVHTENDTQVNTSTVQNIDRNILQNIETVIEKYKECMITSNDNKELFDKYNNKPLESTGSMATGFFPGCESQYDATLASILFHKANSIIYNNKDLTSNIANRYKKTLSIEVADFTDVPMNDNLKKIINTVFKYTRAAEQGYELRWTKDNKLVIALKEEEIKKIMSQYKSLA